MATASGPSEDKLKKLIISRLMTTGDDEQTASCLMLFLKLSGQLEQNKGAIDESNVDQVVLMIREQNEIASLLCTYGLIALAAGFTVFILLFIVCCCTCYYLAAQVCQRKAVISGSKKAKRNYGSADRVEMYSPTSHHRSKQITDV